MAKVVREYAHVLPEAIYGMMKISKNTTENQNGPGIILPRMAGGHQAVRTLSNFQNYKVASDDTEAGASP